MSHTPFHMTFRCQSLTESVVVKHKRVIFQRHKGVLQCEPQNVKRLTINVVQKFPHPNAQARVFEHLGMATTTLHPNESAIQFCLPLGSMDMRYHCKVEAGNAPEEIIN